LIFIRGREAVILLRKAIATLLISILPAVWPARAAAGADTLARELSAKAVALVEANTGRVLFEKNSSERMKIASTTKILTALVALESCDPDEAVEIKGEWTGIEGSSIYLKAGEKLTVRELLYGLMLASGNDAAVALACHTAGGIREFAALMNKRAAELGCKDSSFANPSGLDEDGHFSTARDLAKITAAAMENEIFAEIVSTKQTEAAGRSLKNHNRLLWEYPGTLGVKTGYTKSAGRSLVSCAERDGMRFICVTLDDSDDWADHTALYDWAFEAYERVTIRRGDEIGALIPVISGVKPSVGLVAGAECSFIFARGGEYAESVIAAPFAYAAVARGGLAGELVIESGGEVLARLPVLYAETVRKRAGEKLTVWEQLKRAWYLANEYGVYRGMIYY
jgi:D-alanyl-D-alanine carboxypeptidase (penicillin-binding protein 5/6)